MCLCGMRGFWHVGSLKREHAWNLTGGSAQMEGLAPCGQCPAPLFFPSNSPLPPRPGSEPDRREGAAAGDFQSFQGEVGATPPLPFPSPPLLFLPSLFPSSLLSSSTLPLHLSLKDTMETGRRVGHGPPVCKASVEELSGLWGPVAKAGLQASCWKNLNALA